jgi:hypothetical protein
MSELGSYATTFVLLGALATVATALSFRTIPRQRTVPHARRQ